MPKPGFRVITVPERVHELALKQAEKENLSVSKIVSAAIKVYVAIKIENIESPTDSSRYCSSKKNGC
jgi:hypothetical protein